MGHALRFHNKIQVEESKKIKVNTIMIDIADFEVGAVDRNRTAVENQSMELRGAAQNHLTLMLSMLYTLNEAMDVWIKKRNETGVSFATLTHYDSLCHKVHDMKAGLTGMLAHVGTAGSGGLDRSWRLS